MNSKLILASSSPRRRELLTQAGIDHEVRPSKVDESRIMADHPRTFALRAAYAKAMDVAAAVPEGQWVLAADTVVTRGMILYGKPEGEADAARMLRGLSGQPHQVITGLALAQGGSPNTFLRATATTVQFRQLSDSEIAAYIRTGEPMDKAGAYGIQGLGGGLIEWIDGDYFNVVGLPLVLLGELLEEAGLPSPTVYPEQPERWRRAGRP